MVYHIHQDLLCGITLKAVTQTNKSATNQKGKQYMEKTSSNKNPKLQNLIEREVEMSKKHHYFTV